MPAILLRSLLITCFSDSSDDTHDCLKLTEISTSPHPNLSSTPLSEGEHIFEDGSCSKSLFLCGYAVTSLPNCIWEAHSLPLESAQAAEIMAYIRACTQFKSKLVTIYTDSQYAYGVINDFGKIWAQHGFRTAEGKPFFHSSLITDLLHVCSLPSALVVHC